MEKREIEKILEKAWNDVLQLGEIEVSPGKFLKTFKDVKEEYWYKDAASVASEDLENENYNKYDYEFYLKYKDYEDEDRFIHLENEGCFYVHDLDFLKDLILSEEEIY